MKPKFKLNFKEIRAVFIYAETIRTMLIKEKMRVCNKNLYRLIEINTEAEAITQVEKKFLVALTEESFSNKKTKTIALKPIEALVLLKYQNIYHSDVAFNRHVLDMHFPELWKMMMR